MNSRDAAYDEAVLQRVLEESKSDVKLSSSRSGTRGRKRGSSEGSEEYDTSPRFIAIAVPNVGIGKRITKEQEHQIQTHKQPQQIPEMISLTKIRVQSHQAKRDGTAALGTLLVHPPHSNEHLQGVRLPRSQRMVKRMVCWLFVNA